MMIVLKQFKGPFNLKKSKKSQSVKTIKNKLHVVFTVFIVTIACGANTETKKTLKTSFDGKFLYGAALNSDQFTDNDKRAIPILKNHFNSITPENEMKWMYLQPSPDSFYFDLSDKFVEFGMSNDMHMVGHTLIWHNQIPDWVFFHKDGTKLSREELLIRMKNHIYKVVGRYKGKINAWDVVNEALNDDGSMRNSLWYQIIGDDYVAQAFKFAHEADPNAELYYNDYNLHKSSKADGAVQLINEIQNQGIRVTGIGMQGHWGLDYPTKEELEESIKKFKELGYIAITELDIDVLPNPSGYQGADLNVSESSSNELNPYKSFLPDTIQNKQIVQFQMLHEVFIEHSNKINRVTTWGVTDGDSWKNEWPVPNRTNYPLLFDRNGKAKPIVDSIIQLVDNK